MVLVTRDHCSASPPCRAVCVKTLLLSDLPRVTACQLPHSETSRHPPASQPVRRYPPLASLSSLHLLIKELLVLEWREKKTQMQKYGSHLVNGYYILGVSPWIFAYTYFGNKTRWKECRVRKIDHKRKASVVQLLINFSVMPQGTPMSSTIT